MRGPIRLSEFLFSSDGVKDHLNVHNPKNCKCSAMRLYREGCAMLMIQGIKKIRQIAVDIPISELNNVVFWTNKMSNPRTGERLYFFEYVIRATMDYPVATFEYIVPRTGLFKDPLTARIPSPEELASDVNYVKEATLGAVQTVTIAMVPYNRPGAARHASARTSTRNSRRKATQYRQPIRTRASTALIDGSLDETVARSNVAMQPFGDIQAGPSLSLPTQDHPSSTISASADVTTGVECDEERVGKSSLVEEAIKMFMSI